MRQVRGSGSSSWPLALTVSLVLHSGVVLAMRLVEWPPVNPEDPVDPLVVWMSDWIPEPPTEPLEPEPEALDPEEVEPEEVAEIESEPEELEPADETQPEQLADAEADPDEDAAPSRSFTPIRRSIDWQAEALRAVVMARETREQSESYVAFGFPFESVEGLDSRTSENYFELEARYGEDGETPERDANGDLVIYRDDGCYQIVGTGSILLADANRFSDLVPMGGLRCPRPAETRTDLFEEQKPEYLR